MNSFNTTVNSIWSHLPKFTVVSADFTEGSVLPAIHRSGKFGVPDGKDVSPELTWSGFPQGTQSFAVHSYDPDAPTGSGFWHWAVFNIPATVTSLAQGAGSDGGTLPTGAVSLNNDGGFPGYIGAAPPAGHGPHRYVFTVHAVDVKELEVPPTASPALLGFNLFFHTLATASITAIYEQLS